MQTADPGDGLWKNKPHTGLLVDSS